jgi:DNA-binding GntR family transcriptional regulator
MKTSEAKESTTPKRPGQKALSADDIYERILTAVMERRLKPGVQLIEERLAKVFDVSRTKVRLAISRLAHDAVVTLYPNRGAFIASPTIEQARYVFDARRLIEPELVRRVARNSTKAQVASLRAHLLRETEARTTDDRRTTISLSGEFHQLVAEMAGNPILVRTMREIESLTSLIIILYDAPNAPACPCDEHSALVDAIEARDTETATQLMLEHLQHIEDALDIALADAQEVPLEDVFS